MSETVTLPHPNSYKVPGTRILAGEYPFTPVPAEARQKLQAHLDAGITCFIDLTEAHELDAYEPLLRELGAARGFAVEYRRLPIVDNDVPTRSRMAEILDAVDAAHAVGHVVYVHCWGGVGRTGTVVGCHLVRHGRSGDEALEQVGALFATMSQQKTHRHRYTGSPQTKSQREFVRSWKEVEKVKVHAVATDARRDRLRGALVGLAVGDAVGTTVEFKRPGSFEPVTDMVGGGPFRLRPGQWTDDTSMALCLAESLIECDGFDAEDQMRRFVRWRREGHLSSTGHCFDIGGTTSDALSRFERTGEPFSGSTDPYSAGNGSLMRLAPVVMFYDAEPARALQYAAMSSRTTHGARVAVDACRYLAALLLGAFDGVSKDALLSPFYSPVPGYWDEQPLASEIAEIAAGSFLRKEPPAIMGSGYAAHCLEAALWAFARTDDFRSGCLAAVNLGDDADTTAAVYGQIAGAYYGEHAIPAEWRDRLALRETLGSFADGLV
jgi:ADP-ribosyl-[dinitrogen reductase] hydrolase